MRNFKFPLVFQEGLVNSKRLDLIFALNVDDLISTIQICSGTSSVAPILLYGRSTLVHYVLSVANLIGK